MKQWTKEAMEEMVNNHHLFEENSKSVQTAKTMLLTASDGFYMSAYAVQSLAKFICQYNRYVNVADVVHWLFTEVLDF